MRDLTLESRLKALGAQGAPASPVAGRMEIEIEKGIRRGKLERIRKRRSFYAAAAALLVAVNLLSIRLFPAYAEAVARIPGLERFVALIAHDRGLVDAIDNDFYQASGVSDTEDGATLTVEGLIADNSRIVLFYSLEDAEDAGLDLRNVRIRGPQGAPLEASYSFGPFPMDQENSKGLLRNTLVISLAPDTKVPESLTVDFFLSSETDRPSGASPGEARFTLAVPIDTTRIDEAQETLVLDRAVSTAGQKILFRTLTIHPTRLEVFLEYAADNTMEIFGFENLRFEDADGNRWTPITGGVTASHLDDLRHLLYFESNYFRYPETLRLEADGIRALPKDADRLVLDLENQEIVEKPDDRIALKSLTPVGDGIRAEFSLKAPETFTGGFNLFKRDFEDASGETLHIGEIGWSREPDGTFLVRVVLPETDRKGKAVLHIGDYPAYLTDPISFSVK